MWAKSQRCADAYIQLQRMSNALMCLRTAVYCFVISLSQNHKGILVVKQHYRGNADIPPSCNVENDLCDAMTWSINPWYQLQLYQSLSTECCSGRERGATSSKFRVSGIDSSQVSNWILMNHDCRISVQLTVNHVKVLWNHHDRHWIPRGMQRKLNLLSPEPVVVLFTEHHTS